MPTLPAASRRVRRGTSCVVCTAKWCGVSAGGCNFPISAHGAAAHARASVHSSSTPPAQVTACVPPVSRVLVCLFFVNQAQEAVDLHRYYSYAARTAPPRHKPRVPPYPYLQVLVVVPTAVLCALGYRVAFTAAVLTVDMLREEGRVVSSALAGWFIAGTRPNELQVKTAAVLGCIVLVLTSALRDDSRRQTGHRTRDWVGLLDDGHAVRGNKTCINLCGGCVCVCDALLPRGRS